MKKIVIIVGSCCYNRGSEAIVRGTAAIIKRHIPQSHIVVSSAGVDFGSHVGIEGVDEYVKRYSYGAGFSLNRLCSVILKKIFKMYDSANKIRYKNLLIASKDADVVLVTGGDNYDKSYDMFDMMHSLNKLLRKNSKAKMVMFDCSLAADEIDDNVINDFNLFDAITAREIVTYEALKKVFGDDRVHYFPDPAFAMEAKSVPLPRGFKKDKTVGVNVSSLVTEVQYGSNPDNIISAYVKLIQMVLSKTDYSVMLIPHVMRRLDLSVLEILYEHFKDDERVLLITNENYNAAELKYLISQCRLYVGARTHSTIAAYSSKVPTLVLGYSIKSIGIATDLFGTVDGYVVPTNNLKTDNDFAYAFEKIMEREDKIRKHYSVLIPQYIEKAWGTGEFLKKLCEEKEVCR